MQDQSQWYCALNEISFIMSPQCQMCQTCTQWLKPETLVMSAQRNTLRTLIKSWGRKGISNFNPNTQCSCTVHSSRYESCFPCSGSSNDFRTVFRGLFGMEGDTHWVNFSTRENILKDLFVSKCALLFGRIFRSFMVVQTQINGKQKPNTCSKTTHIPFPSLLLGCWETSLPSEVNCKKLLSYLDFHTHTCICLII